MKLKELENILSTTENSIIYLRENHLLAESFRCPKCRNLMSKKNIPRNKSIDQEEFYCYKRSCRTSRTIRHGSFFKKSHLSLSEIMTYIYAWCWQYPRHIIEHEFGFAQSTIVDWSRFCRDLLVEKYAEATFDMIGGDGIIVEIDESIIVKRKYNVGRMPTSEQWMFGGIERRQDGLKNYFIEFVDCRSADTLIPIIQRRIRQGSIIMSDGWASYRNLINYGYEHHVVVHNENFVDPENPEIYTQNIENLWLILKRFLRKNGTNRQPHDLEYVAEFFFRWKNDDIFESFLQIIKNKYTFRV